MGRINVLDEETSNKIAAGEVIERSGSVVKELIENSIDAGAKNIVIETKDGGQSFIKVTDDGCGIHPDDIKTAFLPHATSKISYIEDIFKIKTLGFRGEALPSIAAVSKTIMKTRTPEFYYGKEISISGGNIDYIKDTGSNVGTSIIVENLFYNVPARKKFMKSPQSESAFINDIVGKTALSHNNISFKLINNGKNVISTYSSSDLKDTIRYIYDKNICSNIIYFEKNSDLLSVYGYIGNAEISRKSRNNQSIFINKRYVKSRLLTAAVENAFKSFLTINKFPFFILFVDIYPEMVDINVHPTKSEVKFNNEREMFKVVFDAVHEAIKGSLTKSFDPHNKDTTINNESSIIKSSAKNDIYSNENGFNGGAVFESNDQTQREVVQIPIDLKPETNRDEKSDAFENRKSKIPDLRIIGQFHSTYILAEYENDLYLIDQHAAHEKILFERYRYDIKNGSVIAQILIKPVILELEAEDFDYYIKNKEIFSQCGFQIEIFGDNTISIREVPIILGKPDIKNLFIDIIDNLKNMGTGKAIDVKYNAIATLACKAAIKANNQLNEPEMKSLIHDLGYLDEPFTCPHGRPTVIKVSLTEIEKKFKRIQ